MPDRQRFRAYLRFLGIFYISFVPAYFCGALLAGRLAPPMPLYMGWELSIPFFEPMVWIYLSLYPMFLVPLFQLTPQEMNRLAGQALALNLFALAVFALFPGVLGYAAVEVSQGLTGWAVGLVKAYDTPHNLVPSLHVGFTLVILLAAMDAVTKGWCMIYGTWLILLCASTLLVHQHHLIDLVTAAGVVFAIRWFLPAGSGVVQENSQQ